MRRSRGGLANCDGSRPETRTALNSASQQRNASRRFRNQEIDSSAGGACVSCDEEGESDSAEELGSGGERRSEKRSETCFWKSSRSMTSWS